MGRYGPIAASEESKNLTGNPGKRPAKRRVNGPEGAPTLPAWLPDDAKQVWRKLIPVLAKMNIISKLDQEALADMCTVIVRLRNCEADIQARGVLVEGERGMVKNPACQLAREYRQSLQRWATEFGLTPAGRARLSLPDAPREDELSALLS